MVLFEMHADSHSGLEAADLCAHFPVSLLVVVVEEVYPYIQACASVALGYTLLS